jgi:hypothetical protein
MSGPPARRIVVLVADRSTIRTGEGGPVMHATIQTFRQWPDEESEEWAAGLLGTLTDDAAPQGCCVLGRLDGMDGAVFGLWDDEPSAVAAVSRTADGARWIDARVFQVMEVEPGTAAEEPARFAQLVWLDTAGDADRADVALRSGRERIAPATRDVPGVVGTYVLRAEDHRMVAVTLVTGVEVPEALRRAIFSTSLLPWEDLSALTGVERVDIDRVLVDRMPAPAHLAVRS